MEGSFSEMIKLVERAASVSDVDEIKQDVMKYGIHSAAMDRNGSELIGKLVDTAYRLGHHEVAESIFTNLTRDRARLLPVLQQKIGFNVLVLVSDYSVHNDELANLLLEGSVFIILLKTLEDPHSFAAFFFERKLSPAKREEFLFMMSTNILDFSANERSASNISAIISSANDVFNRYFIYLIENHLLSISRSEEGNLIVQALISYSSEVSEMVLLRLKGEIVSLATSPYSRFVVQCFFDSGSALCVRRTFSEIINGRALDYLIFDKYGNYVVQSLLRRLRTLNSTHFDMIASKVLGNAAVYGKHQFAVHVLREVRILCNSFPGM